VKMKKFSFFVLCLFLGAVLLQTPPGLGITGGGVPPTQPPPTQTMPNCCPNVGSYVSTTTPCYTGSMTCPTPPCCILANPTDTALSCATCLASTSTSCSYPSCCPANGAVTATSNACPTTGCGSTCCLDAVTQTACSSTSTCSYPSCCPATAAGAALSNACATGCGSTCCLNSNTPALCSNTTDTTVCQYPALPKPKPPVTPPPPTSGPSTCCCPGIFGLFGNCTIRGCSGTGCCNVYGCALAFDPECRQFGGSGSDFFHGRVDIPAKCSPPRGGSGSDEFHRGGDNNHGDDHRDDNRRGWW